MVGFALVPRLTSDPLRKVVGHFIPGEVGRAGSGSELLARVTQNYNNGIIVETRGGRVPALPAQIPIRYKR